MYDNLKFSSERFEKALKERKLKQVEVAKQTGISPDTFTNYKKGRVPETEYLYALAQFFVKPMEWFLIEEEEEAAGMVLACEEPQDKKSDDLTLEEMYEILETLMSSSNNMRGWTITQFRQAFGKYCRKTTGVKEGFARYVADKKNIQ